MLELIAMVCIGAAWLIPNHYPPWSSIYNESAAALGLLFVALAAGRKWFIQGAPVTAWVVAAAAAIPWMQWAFGLLRFSGDAAVASLYVLGLAAAIASGHAWSSRSHVRESSALLSGCTVAAAVVSSMLALVQAFHLGSLSIWMLDAMPGTRPYANLGQPNNLATLLGLGVLGLLLLREQNRLAAGWCVCLLVSLVVAAAATQSRTALLFGPVILLGLWLARTRGIEFKTSAWVVVLATALHWALTLGFPLLQGPEPNAEAVLARGAGSLRFQMWPLLFDALQQSPWTGYGWLQVGAAELAVADRHPPVGELWMHGHNLFFELLLWAGWPIGLILCGLIAWWLIARARCIATIEAAMGMLMVAIVGLHAMLELPHHYAYFLVPIGLWIGMVESSVEARSWLSPHWSPAPVVFAAMLTLALWRHYPEVEEDFRLVRFESFRIGNLRAKELTPHAPFLSSLTAFLRFARTEPTSGMTELQLAAMEAVVKRYPYAASMYRYACALALNGRLNEATPVFLKIRHMHGEAHYANLKRMLHDRVTAGERGLQALEASLLH